MWKWLIGICTPIAAMIVVMLIAGVKHRKNNHINERIN